MDPIEDMPAGSVTRSKKLSKASSLALLWLVAAPFGSLAGDFLMHPLCLDALPLDFFDETGGIERALVCAAYPEAEIEGTPNGWVRAVRPINNEEGLHEGWISYKVAGHFPGLWDEGMFYLLEVGSNTGGTGIFSSLWMLEQLSERPVFWPWLHVPGGDRCNDGQLRGLELSATTLVYTHAATPFRLLNSTDQTDWRWEALRALGSPDDVSPSTFLNWRPYDDVANCAICCVGNIVNEMDLNTGNTQVTGVYVNRNEWSNMFRPDDWLKDCTNEWLNGLAIPGPEDEAAYVALNAWTKMLKDLGRRCADVRPGSTK